MKKLLVHAIIENTIHFTAPEDRTLVALTIPNAGFNGFLTSIYYQIQALQFLETASNLITEALERPDGQAMPGRDELIATNTQLKEYLQRDAGQIVAASNVTLHQLDAQRGVETKITIPDCGAVTVDTGCSETIAALVRLLLDSPTSMQLIERVTPWVGNVLAELKNAKKDTCSTLQSQFDWAVNHRQFKPESMSSAANMLRIHGTDMVECVNGTVVVDGIPVLIEYPVSSRFDGFGLKGCQLEFHGECHRKKLKISSEFVLYTKI